MNRKQIFPISRRLHGTKSTVTVDPRCLGRENQESNHISGSLDQNGALPPGQRKKY